MKKILIFDLGTTYFKVCLFDETGQIVGLHRLATPLENSADGRSELPIPTFRQCLIEATSKLSLEVGGFSDVVAVSFASQANSFVLLDQQNEPLTPFLLWNDQRALGLDNPLQPLFETPEFYEKTGVPAVNHEFLPAKIHWLQQHEPSVLQQTNRLMLISDYLTWWMTGNHLTEAGVAGLTGLVDIHRLQWWPQACERIGLPLEWLPMIVRAGTDAGILQGKVAEEFGLPHDCRFVVGCLDQYSGAIGAGNVEPGGISETTGTVLATVRCSDSFQKNATAAVFQGPSWKQGQYYQMVFSDISAGLLERYRNSLPDRPSFEQLDNLASEIPSGADGLKLQSDAPRRKVDDLFSNRQAHHARGHEVRAILESVARELERQVKLLCGQHLPSELISVGGAAQSHLWEEIKSDQMGINVRPTPCTEPTSLGAAMLVRLTICGISLREISQQWVINSNVY